MGYWDRDGGGTLDREEFTRAMVKTFCVNVWGDPVLSRAQETRELGGMIWRNQGLHEFDAISFEDFIKPYGLYDTRAQCRPGDVLRRGRERHVRLLSTLRWD